MFMAPGGSWSETKGGKTRFARKPFYDLVPMSQWPVNNPDNTIVHLNKPAQHSGPPCSPWNIATPWSTSKADVLFHRQPTGLPASRSSASTRGKGSRVAAFGATAPTASRSPLYPLPHSASAPVLPALPSGEMQLRTASSRGALVRPSSAVSPLTKTARLSLSGSLAGRFIHRQIGLSEYEKSLRKEAFETDIRHLAMEWDAMDFDRNRKLDFGEFSKLVREREMAINSEDALQARFHELDKDGTGLIEMPEMIKFALRDALSRSAVPMATLLSSFDGDGNGQVDRDEFRRAVRQLGFRAANIEIDEVFNEFDLSGDGLLEPYEFEKRMADMTTSQNSLGLAQNALRDLSWRQGAVKSTDLSIGLQNSGSAMDEARVADMRRGLIDFLQANMRRVMDIFRTMDTNGDGLLTKKELRTALSKIGFTPPQFSHAEAARQAELGDEVDQFFELMDKDGSGSVEYNEFKRVLRRKAKATNPAATAIVTKATSKVALRKAASSGALSKTLQGATLKADKLDVASMVQQVAAALARNLAKVSSLFAEWDIDGNGRLSRRELREAMRVLGIGSREASDALFASIDRDGSGEIELNELIRTINGAAQSGRGLFSSSMGTEPTSPEPTSGPEPILPDLFMGLHPARRPEQRVAKQAPLERKVDIQPANRSVSAHLPWQHGQLAPLPEEQQAAFTRPQSVAPPQLRISCDTGAPTPQRAPISESEWYSQWMVVVREETAAMHMRG